MVIPGDRFHSSHRLVTGTKVTSLRPLTVLAGATILCIAALGFAHRLPGSLSTIKKSPTGNTFEIIHRLHNHDAELGIATVLGLRDVSLENLEARAQLALYVEERFVIARYENGAIGTPLSLELIGAELDGEYVLVYQEYAGDLPAEIAVRNDILRDVFPAQVNQVNVSAGGKVRSLTFGDDDAWLTLRLEEK